jgi:hypothetical protein
LQDALRIGFQLRTHGSVVRTAHATAMISWIT